MPSVGRFIEASPDAAWDLIACTRSWPSWGPSVSAVEPSGALLSAGMRGRVRTPLGVWLPFTITRFEPPHRWSWSVLGVPATSHRVEMAPGGCRVSFGVPLPALAYLAVCRLALGRIAEQLEHGRQRPLR
jgi:hypothetical protein